MKKFIIKKKNLILSLFLSFMLFLGIGVSVPLNSAKAEIPDIYDVPGANFFNIDADYTLFLQAIMISGGGERVDVSNSFSLSYVPDENGFRITVLDDCINPVALAIGFKFSRFDSVSDPIAALTIAEEYVISYDVSSSFQTFSLKSYFGLIPDNLVGLGCEPITFIGSDYVNNATALFLGFGNSYDFPDSYALYEEGETILISNIMISYGWRRYPYSPYYYSQSEKEDSSDSDSSIDSSIDSSLNSFDSSSYYEEYYDSGFNEGFDIGYDVGFQAGEEHGYDSGYDVGFQVGEEHGYDSGYDVGFQVGEEHGYDSGFSQGLNYAKYGFFYDCEVTLNLVLSLSDDDYYVTEVPAQFEYVYGGIVLTSSYLTYNAEYENSILESWLTFSWSKSSAPPITDTLLLKAYGSKDLFEKDGHSVYWDIKTNNSSFLPFLNWSNLNSSNNFGDPVYLSSIGAHSGFPDSRTRVISFDTPHFANLNYLLGFTLLCADNQYSAGYESGYIVGTEDGRTQDYDSIFNDGYISGKDDGYKIGLNQGLSDDPIGLGDFMYTFLDMPGRIISNFLNFDFLGVNLLGLVTFLLSICLVAFVLKKVV